MPACFFMSSGQREGPTRNKFCWMFDVRRRRIGGLETTPGPAQRPWRSDRRPRGCARSTFVVSVRPATIGVPVLGIARRWVGDRSSGILYSVPGIPKVTPAWGAASMSGRGGEGRRCRWNQSAALRPARSVHMGLFQSGPGLSGPRLAA